LVGGEYNQAVTPSITRPLVVTTTRLMLGKILEF